MVTCCEVHSSPTFCGGHRETEGEVGLTDTVWSKHHYVFLAFKESQSVQAFYLVPLHAGLEAAVEVGERLHSGKSGRAYRGLETRALRSLMCALSN